ncbi:hypothetical protein E2C01_049301 [Portunus trituberculatus]|uniref:Chitin-binding type-2 domain-containing protein n=1 Tax=Portunus trituberculatus TaxID=210409 RepID=A0A5B7GDW6_PORTR|nr:hypothetical protein [Portunus trituberculatus]
MSGGGKMKAQDNVILMTAKDQLAAVDRWGGGKDENVGQCYFYDSEGSTGCGGPMGHYWVCISELGILELCGPGTVWDQDLHLCNWEGDVDLSHCHQWICSVDNTYYPHPDCDKSYEKMSEPFEMQNGQMCHAKMRVYTDTIKHLLFSNTSHNKLNMEGKRQNTNPTARITNRV